MKHAVAGMLAENYHSAIIERIKAEDFTYRAGRLTVHLAREFGFCYGVDRAVDYAYQTRERFPDRQVYLTGEIIHNPHVNEKLRAMGIRFLNDEGQGLDQLTAEGRSSASEIERRVSAVDRAIAHLNREPAAPPVAPGPATPLPRRPRRRQRLGEQGWREVGRQCRQRLGPRPLVPDRPRRR